MSQRKIVSILIENDYVLAIRGRHVTETGIVREITPVGTPIVVFNCERAKYMVSRKNLTILARKNTDHLRTD